MYLKKLLICLIMLVSIPVCSYAADEKVLFSDDFDKSIGNWNLEESSGFSAQGKELMYNGSLYGRIITNKSDFGNGEFFADIKSGTASTIGVLFGYKNTGNHSLVKIYPQTGKVLLLRKSEGGSYIKLGAAAAELQKDKSFNLHITFNGESISVKIDDKEIICVQDEHISSGAIGFEGAIGRFSVDNIKFSTYNDREYEEIKVVEKDNFQSDREARVIYVSPDGNDKNSGEESAPLATLNGARKKVQELKKGRTPVTVVFKEGEYVIDKTVEFTGADSGSAGAPITYKAEEGANVVFTGAKTLDVTEFKKVTDREILERFPQKSKDKIMQLDLSKYGITKEFVDCHTKFTNPATVGESGMPVGIYLNDEKQPISRWPNVGYNTIEDATKGGQYVKNNGIPVYGPTGADDCAVMSFSQINPTRWTKAKDMLLEGFFIVEWCSEWSAVKEIDVENRTITFATWTAYGVGKGHKWAAINLLEEIDIPGEWYIDKDTLTLYYYPPHELTNENDTFEIAVLNDSFINMNNTKYVIFDGLTFTKNSPNYEAKTKTKSLNLYNTDCIKFDNCRIENAASCGLTVEGTNTLIENSVINNCGEEGMTIRGGNSNTLTYANNIVRNCQIMNTNRDSGSYAVAVNLYGCGGLIENNIFTNLPNCAVRTFGAGHTIRNNEIYNVVRDAGDAGAIYAGRSMIWAGNLIENNYIHDVSPLGEEMRYAANAYFLDDMMSGTTFRNNIVYMNNPNSNVAAVKVGGGSYNEVTGNTLIGCETDIIGEDRSSYIKDYAASGNGTLKELLSFPYNVEPFKSKYPYMAKIVADTESHDGMFIPNNNISNNLSVDVKQDKISSFFRENGTVENNVTTDRYDIFVDPDNQDFRVKLSAKEELGISADVLDETFDLDSIGPKDTDVNPKDAFSLIYPKNGLEIEVNDVILMWEKADYANQYVYTVAEDKDFSKIVKEGKVTMQTSVVVPGLEHGKTYYWKVEAINLSRTGNGSWENADGVCSFTTALYDTLDKSLLLEEIDKAEKFVETIEEGDKVGDYKAGTKQEFEAAIESAKATLRITSGTQDEIDTAASTLVSIQKAADSFKNVGYSNLEIDETDTWSDTSGKAVINVDGNVVNMQMAEGGADLVLEKELPTTEVLNFKAKLEAFNNNWCGFSIRRHDSSVPSYNDSAYLVVVKEDVFELQSKGILETHPNNGIFKENTWHNIQFAAVNTTGGVNIVFKVDGEVVFDYLHQTDPVLTGGKFGVRVINGMSVAPADSIPEGFFELSQATKNTLEGKEEKIYNIHSDEYSETGTWTDGTALGYENSPSRITTEKDASVMWSPTTSKYGLYKIYYWCSPTENSDKNVKVKCSGYAGEYSTTVDMSTGEEGFRELGTFMLQNESYSGSLGITFTGSGTGELSVSNLKIERVDPAEYPNMLK